LTSNPLHIGVITDDMTIEFEDSQVVIIEDGYIYDGSTRRAREGVDMVYNTTQPKEGNNTGVWVNSLAQNDRSIS